MSDNLGRINANVAPQLGHRHLLAVVEILVMMIMADDVVDHAEVQFLMDALAEKPLFQTVEPAKLMQMVVSARKLDRRHDVATRLSRLKTVLTPELRRQVYVMIYELRAVDGHVDVREQSLLVQVQEAFELTDAEVASLVGDSGGEPPAG